MMVTKRWSSGLSTLDKVEIRDRVIVSSIKDAFGILKDSIPPEEIAKAVRPYFTHCGMAISLNCSKRFNITGKDIKELAIPYYWTGHALSGRNCSSMMVYEKGIVIETLDCCLCDIGAEFCLPLSYDATEGICRSLNPNFHYHFTHKMYDGDDYCRYIIRHKGHRKDIEDLGELKEVVKGLDMPDEEVDSLRREMIGELLIIVNKVLVDVNGTERTLTKLLPVSNRTGLELGKEIGALLENIKDGRGRAAEALTMIRSSMSQDDIREISEDDLITGCTTACPFKDGNVALCKQYESVLNGVCKAIDPRLEFVYTHMMTKGDARCAWTIGRSMRRDKVETRADAVDDPLLTLKMRFARGDISEGEYLKARDVLLGK